MPSFSYVPNIPAANNTPAQDQPNMQSNTNAIANLVDVDLYGFNDNNGGYHQQSTYVEQSVDPVPNNASGNQAILYSKFVSSIAEIFLTRNGSVTPVKMTAGPAGLGTNYSPSGIVYQNNWQSFLPGGIMIKSGQVSKSSGGTSVAINFSSIGLSNFTTGYAAFLCPQNTLVSMAASVISPTGFTATWSSSTPLAFYWVAIGV